MHTEPRPPFWLAIVVAAANLIALASLPYGYYQLLRIVVTGYAILVAWHGFTTNRPLWPWIFGLMAIIYNPVFKISMTRDLHAVVNVATAAIVIFEALVARRASHAR